MTSIFTARGLTNLITDIRACANKELEQQRVDKELAKIRNKFTQLNVLNSYDKRKYIWKLLYIFMLGYEIDFGHLQVINLLSSPKYAEKSIGYIGTSLLLKSSDELMTLVINSIRNDLIATNSANQCLALACLANIGGNELTEALSGDVLNTLMSPNSTNNVKKKAALCLCRMLQSNPEIIKAEEILPHLIKLLQDRNLGVVTSVASVALKIVVHDPLECSNLTNAVVERLTCLVLQKTCAEEYLYYTTPCPWLQVKLLRLLQYLPPPKDQALISRLYDIIKRILSRPESSKPSKNNAVYAVLFETINLVIVYGPDMENKVFDQSVSLLGKFLTVLEPNIRYIALETMSRLARIEGTVDAMKKHQDIVLASLKDADISVRRRALDLLFVMCDHENAIKIVEEMVNHLVLADVALREIMVLKIAILAEQFAKDLRWYVDTVLRLISIAGSVVSDDIWHRVVQIITNKEELQKYAAEMMFQALEPQHVHETTIKVGAYVLGEFGYLLADQEEMSADKQLEILLRHKKNSSFETGALILTALIKMAHLYEPLRPKIMEVIEKSKCHVNLEIQQRSMEYSALPSLGDEVMAKVLEAIPVFPQDRESALLVRLKSKSSTEEQQRESHPSPSKPSQTCETNLSTVANPEEDLLNINYTSEKIYNQSLDASAPAISRSPSPVDSLASSTAPPPPAPVPTRAPQLDVNLLREYFKKTIRNSQGVLYEDPSIQVGIKQEFKAAQGRLNLFFGNKCNKPLTSFEILLLPDKALRMQSPSVQSTIGPGEQAKHQILVECYQPFIDPPQMTISYEIEGKVTKIPLRLPVVAATFIEPVSLTNDDFMKRWTALEGNEREKQAVFNMIKPFDIVDIQKLLTSDMKFSIIKDNLSETAIAAAGTFRTMSVTANGDKVSVGCLLRLEVNLQAKAYRLTVRAVHGDISTSVKNVLVQLLS